MTISAAVVLYAVTWFLVFLMALPVGQRSQAEAGEIVPGTPPGAPATHMVGKKAKITTVIALVLWALFYWIITSGMITVRDFDMLNRMPPLSQEDK